MRTPQIHIVSTKVEKLMNELFPAERKGLLNQKGKELMKDYSLVASETVWVDSVKELIQLPKVKEFMENGTTNSEVIKFKNWLQKLAGEEQ